MRSCLLRCDQTEHCEFLTLLLTHDPKTTHLLCALKLHFVHATISELTELDATFDRSAVCESSVAINQRLELHLTESALDAVRRLVRELVNREQFLKHECSAVDELCELDVFDDHLDFSFVCVLSFSTI